MLESHGGLKMNYRWGLNPKAKETACRCFISSIFAKLKKILWLFAYVKTSAPANACFNASFASSSHATEYLLNGRIKYAIYHLKRGKKFL
jgi:hypothetical protein